MAGSSWLGRSEIEGMVLNRREKEQKIIVNKCYLTRICVCAGSSS